MRQMWRIAVVFVLAAAVPLQGIAAATMAVCGPAHEASVHDASATSHDPARAAPAHDDAMHRHAGADADGVQQGADAAHPGADKSTSKCSVCAACCAASAMPSPSVGFETVVLTEIFSADASTGAAVFLTTGLERPPRTFLA